jgi:hypothetical protein
VEEECAAAFVHQLSAGADVQSAAQVALEAGNSPQIIFQHYRELVRPKEAKSWFSIEPGTNGKILYVDVKEAALTEAEQPAVKGEIQSAAQAA